MIVLRLFLIIMETLMAKISIRKMLDARVETQSNLLEEQRKTISRQQQELERFYTFRRTDQNTIKDLDKELKNYQHEYQVIINRLDAQQWLNVLAHIQVKELQRKIRFFEENNDSLALAAIPMGS